MAYFMERKAEVVRGWPYDGALDANQVIKAGVTLVNGDWVELQADGTVDKVGATKTNRAGLVIVGNGDSGSAAYSGKAVVLWSNFIVRVSNAVGSFTPNAAVTAQDGVLVPGVVGTDPILGHVTATSAAGADYSASASVGSITVKVGA